LSSDLATKFLAVFDDSQYPPDFLQRYELMECLAHNELGETLLVRDQHTDELYVAKCYADRSLLPRTTESSLLRNFHHDGLPAFVGEYQNESMLCVVRGYVAGTPLDRLACRSALSPRQSTDIISQLCDILTYLHGQNPPIIHRDIKPQNIIVDEHGHITLIDFGISRTYDENARADTICFGTRFYAAPEQYGFAQSDPRTDIFSAGVLLAWLLTGLVDLDQAKKAIADRRLLAVVEKCTAFDPKDRYRNALQLKDALAGRERRRRRIGLAALASLLLVGAVLLFQRSTNTVHFREPLIEQAVRLSLGLDAATPLTEQDLLAVNQIYILGNQAAADNKALNQLVEEFANGGGHNTRGEVETLQDLTQLKNLREVSLNYQSFSDISPLAQLPYLEIVDMRNNPQIADVSALAGSGTLATLVIFDTSVSDLSMLSSCPKLTRVDIGATSITSMQAFKGLDSLQSLVARRAPLRNLDGIENLAMLQDLYISETPLNDLSPLLALPRLQKVELSEDMRPYAEAIAGRAAFEIVYQ
jgi:serine/threonine protein kinase